MKKRILAMLMSALMLFSVSACDSSDKKDAKDDTTVNQEESNDQTEKKGIAKEDLMVGFVYIGKINDEGYTQAHDKGRLALNELGIKTTYVEEIPENAEAEKAIRDLIDQGCNVIYTCSFGYMDVTEKMSNEFPNVYFGHATGYKTTKNMSTFMGKVFQPRYLSGIAAGMKTKANKIGYVAAMPIPEVIRGINAFTMGVRSVNPEATVEVIWTNTWYDPAKEKQAAIELLNKGVDVMAQHQDTTAPQIAAEEKGAFAIGYNSPTKDAAPKAYLTAPLFHWEVFYVDDVMKIMDGTWVSRKYWEGLSTGMVSLDTLTENCAEGTQASVDTATAGIISGDLQIFQGPIKDNNTGEVMVPEGTAMTDDEIWNMSWFVEGVIGSVPK